MPFNEVILLQIQMRAGFKCEYCGRKLVPNENWEADHIIPRSKGGSNEIQNIAYSCPRCNNNKREYTSYFDPITGEFVLLFNPRVMKWEDHFSKNEITGEIIGTSKIGRATANLLFKYTKQVILPEINWPDLQDYKDSDIIIYQVINKLRISLFQNKYSFIQQTIDNINIAGEDLDLKFILEKIKLESYYARASEKNIVHGINYANILLRQYNDDYERKIQIYNILAILLQQKSTSELLLGNKQWGKYYLKKAYNLILYIAQVSDVLEQKNNYIFNMEANFRKIKWGASKYSLNLKNDIQRYHTQLKDQSKEVQFRGLKFIADLILINEKINFTFVEKIYYEVTEHIANSGYGNTYNITHSVGLRRRWWGLCFIYENSPNYELLVKDLLYWKKIEMHNEIRELKIWHQSIKVIIDNEKWEILNKIFTQY